MSSWTNYGFSALSNVTQSVQALSSYAQGVLHEAREEVESELLGDGTARIAASPTPEDSPHLAQSAAPSLKAPTGFSSRAHLISPPRIQAASRPAPADAAVTSAFEDFETVDQAHDEVLQLQTYVRALESRLASQQQQDATSLETLQRREEECLELHQRLEMQRQQLEDMALENKLLLQAVSQKTAVNDAPPAAPGPPNQKENPALNEQQLEQRLQHTQDELDACQSRLASTTSALKSAEGAISNLTASATAAAAASAAQIDAQAKIISRLEADLDRLKAEAADAEASRVAALSSRQAALALAADHEAEIRRLHALLADVEECSIANKQIEASLSAHAAKDQLEEQEQAAQGSEGDAKQKSGQLAECKAELSDSHIPNGAHDTSVLQQQLQQLQETVDALKDAASAESVSRESVQRENAALAHTIMELSAEISQLQSSCKLQQETNTVHVAGLTSERDALAAQVKSLQAENQSLISNQKKAQRQNDSQEILVLKKELEKYEQGEAKMLLEVNRRLALAKRCSEIGQSALTSLSKCSDIAFTQTPPVDEHASTVTPASVLSILGKYLDHIVVGLMDLKKASDSLAATVPALKTDCDRLMLKIVELEKLRVEWSESQSDLVQTKSALAKQLQQQHVHNQTDASVLSILHSCGGGSAGEQLQQAALRVAEELKTSRMTVSELARQVEVERSSSNSRHRVADSQGSELRASLAAAEQRAAAEVSAVKAQLRSSELHCQQVSLDLQAATKLNAELSEQVSVFESVLAEKDAEVAEVSQQLKLARALVSSLSDQAEVAVNLELVMRLNNAC